MKVRAEALAPGTSPAEVAVLFCREGAWNEAPAVRELAVPLARLADELARSGEFRGEPGETALLHAPDGARPGRLLLAGIGATPDADALRRASSAAARRARGARAVSLAFWLPEPRVAEDLAAAAQAVTEGCLLGAHAFTAYRTESAPSDRPLDSMIVSWSPSLAMPAVDAAAIESGARRGERYAGAANWARDLALHPANVMTPERLGQEALALAALPRVQVEVRERDWILDAGMGGLLAVASGSAAPPRFIEVRFDPPGIEAAPVVLVGKGVTFDSGGISLKERENMGEMKTDMSGAAAVLGALRVAAELEFPVRVIALVPAVENLPGGRAFRPGDVVRMMSGKTVEIISTDAEGRLILADALHYAARFQPAAVVDVATLTAGATIALGHAVSAVMGTDASLVARLRRAGEASGERVWELPLVLEYREQLRSDVADMKNSGGRPANAVTAGLFLGEFAKGYPWAHLDIAGTAFIPRDIGCFPKGATGVGVRLLAEMLRAWNA